ncbi:type VII secretion protein EccB [Streptacidiphilus sp. PB12-B1b]|uniref:type VII secretion protein EccB n=1 Tax=Streptacidiphilus sp. PB12-B1b TaxID=2705012 RepID=UPI0015FBBDE2|nr:type VII secretion protein EccB [Streptacidiphilus sp. PB12-B1b]QMU78797.1 type VII secretion protein EccB [Streptacidiphilus sp. PB12-B1b]
MASRRNELNAYTFSRRRTVAAFLQPSSGGNEEDAPRALRAIVPSVVAGALAVAGFGAYGMIKPSAPLNWQKANAVIVGKQSTTRYVVLGGVLHPVLNIASARLLLGAGSTVVTVDDSVLDSGTVPHGALVGIPYAPDSLPTAKDAGAAKTWAYCDRPASDGQGGTDQKLFVLGGADAHAVSGGGTLDARHALYVQGPDGTTYLVDSTGTTHVLDAGGSDNSGGSNGSNGSNGDRTGRGGQSRQQLLLATAAFGATIGAPQQVSSAWLATLRGGDPIAFPRADMPGYGHAADTRIDGASTTVGETFQVRADSGQVLHYVVLEDGIHRVSDFTDQLLAAMSGRDGGTVAATAVPGANDSPPFEGGKDWPQQSVTQTNSATSGDGTTVACSVYSGTMSASGVPGLGLWAGRSYPVDSSSGTASVYVTPGTGLLYRQITGTSPDTGSVDLLTDTGLRYPVQMNGDSSAAGAQPAPSPSADGGSDTDGSDTDGQQSVNDAQARLGYSGVVPSPVPLAWSSLLSSGPNLNSAAAAQEQGS